MNISASKKESVPHSYLDWTLCKGNPVACLHFAAADHLEHRLGSSAGDLGVRRVFSFGV